MIWNYPEYQFFFLFFWGLMALIGCAIAILNCLSLPMKEKARSIWKAYKSWFVMGPVIFVVVGLGRDSLIICLALLSIFCTKEFAKATGLYRDWFFMSILYLGILGIYLSVWFDWYGLFTAMPIYAIGALFILPILRNRYKGMVQKVGLSTIALIYIGWFLAHLAYFEKFPAGVGFLLYLIIGTELNDAGAFLTGKLFGKHKLVSEISPNKTIEGSFGALLVTALYTWGVSSWLYPLSPSLYILSVLIIWIGGTFGDLVISFVKRDIGVKDMGTLIPGHGGLLDRADSLIFVAPLYFHMLKYFLIPAGTFL